MMIGDRMFDLNAWLDEEAGEMDCVVYLCVEKDGEFTADTMVTSWFLSGRTPSLDGTENH